MALIYCTSKKHNEYDCRIKYSVSHLKFTYDKWCSGCRREFEYKREEFGDK